MTRLSNFFLPTVKEAPADAEAISHRLMVRAGLVRQLGAGMWTWLPAGWRSHRKAEQIVREEIDAIGGGDADARSPAGGQLAPQRPIRDHRAVQAPGPARGRPRAGDDPRGGLTFHISREIRSYRDLPKILYHIQVKERDEPRPRAGVLRTREFIMKDSYSFDRDEDGLDRAYALHIEAYDRIFDRSAWSGTGSSRTSG